MAYHNIVRNLQEIVYINDLGVNTPVNAKVEELEQFSISGVEGGYIPRELIITMLHPVKDTSDSPISITLNNKFLYKGKEYIISTDSLEKPREDFEVINYVKFHCNLLQEEDQVSVIDPIETELKNIIETVILPKTPFSSFEKFKIRTQEDYDLLPYPRVMWDLFKSDVQPSTPYRYIRENKRVVRYSNNWRLEIEYFADSKSRNSLYKLDEFLQDTEKFYQESNQVTVDIFEIVLSNYDTISQNSSFINNEPRKKTLRFIDLLVDYKVIEDYLTIEEFTVQGEVKGGTKNS